MSTSWEWSGLRWEAVSEAPGGEHSPREKARVAPLVGTERLGTKDASHVSITSATWTSAWVSTPR